jgi:hypothetical protein
LCLLEYGKETLAIFAGIGIGGGRAQRADKIVLIAAMNKLRLKVEVPRERVSIQPYALNLAMGVD